MNKLFGFLFVVLFVTSSFSQKLEGSLEIIRTDSYDYLVKNVETKKDTLVGSFFVSIKETGEKQILFRISSIDTGISPEIAFKSFQNCFSPVLIDTVSVKDSCVSLFPVKFKKCVYISEAQYFPETGTLKPVLRLVLEENKRTPIFIYVSFGLILCAIILFAFFKQYKNEWFAAVFAVAAVVAVAGTGVVAGAVVLVLVGVVAGAAVLVLVGAVAGTGAGTGAVAGVLAGVLVIISLATTMQSWQAGFIMLAIAIFVFLLTRFIANLFKKQVKEK